MLYEFLRTEFEYRSALERLDQLVGAPPGSPLGEELQALMEQIQAYEDEHFPFDD